MANILKKAVSNLFEKMLTSAQVTEVRAWQPASMYEVEIHIPTIGVEKWNTIKRLKCKVGELEFRDYTPCLWNAEKRTCTLYIEAGHNGAGSGWVKQLKKGDEVLLGAAHAAQLPHQEGKILCLGDGSALGHFLGLKQLTERSKYPVEAAVFFHDAYEIPQSLMMANPEFEFIMQPKGNNIDLLAQWLMSKDLSNYVSVYIAGNIPMVTGLRRKLKALPEMRAKIHAHGFWS